MSNGPAPPVVAGAVAVAGAVVVVVAAAAPDPIPVCTVFASDSAPLINTSIVLSASCTGNPTSYSWSGVSCSGVQCAAYQSNPGTAAYSVVASNATGTGAAAGVTVEWKTQAAAPTPQCTLTASDYAPLIGQTITIASSCTNSPTSYTWGGCASTGTNCTDSVGVAGSKTYSLTASNGAGAGNRRERRR